GILAVPQASRSAVTPPPRNRPRCVRASVSASLSTRPRRSSRSRASPSRTAASPPSTSGFASRHPREHARLVQPQPEHDPFALLDLSGELFELSLGSPAFRKRLQVARQPG